MLKELVEFLINKGREEDPIHEVKGIGTFSTVDISEIKAPTPNVIGLNTLTSLIDYVKNNVDKVQGKLIVEVSDPQAVRVYSPLRNDMERNQYVVARPMIASEINYGRFYDREEFNIALQSRFINNSDRNLVIDYISSIKEDEGIETIDDGIGQVTTVRTGAVTLSKAVVPNPVILKPYRTFLEVDQPESSFVFRIKKGPQCALFEADGGAWKNQAILNIKEYLVKELAEVADRVEIIA